MDTGLCGPFSFYRYFYAAGRCFQRSFFQWFPAILIVAALAAVLEIAAAGMASKKNRDTGAGNPCL